jgi:hypothetical protein
VMKNHILSSTRLLVMEKKDVSFKFIPNQWHTKETPKVSHLPSLLHHY